MNDLPWSLHTTSAPLGHKGVSDAKQIRAAGGIQALHICPATNNLPTRMTRDAWDVLCAATQERSRERECIDKNQAQLMRMTKRLNVCSWCKGEILPRGLEFITKEELVAMTSQKREEEMAKQSKLGVCENCGEKSALTTSYGKRVCTTCLKIRSSVQNHVDKIAISARSLGKGEALLSALVPDGGGLAIKVTADLLQVISGLVGYTGEDPDELVAAVRTATALGAHQLTSEAEAGALRTIAGIVGYEGTDGEQLVEAVRRRVLTCASCEAEDVLREIREIVGYSPDMGDSGLADAVRRLALRDASSDCADCTALRGDLLRACGLEMDDTEDGDGWDVAAAAAIQEIAELTNRRDDLLALLTKERAAELNADDTRLRDELTRTGAEVEGLRGDLDRSTRLITELRDKLQETQSGLLWYRVTVDGIKEKLGMGADDDFGEAPEQIASMMHAFGRFQQMAENEAKRADLLQDDLARRDAIIANLRDQVAATDEALVEQELWKPEPAPTVPASTWADESLLADFGRRVLRGEVAVQFLGGRL